MKKMGEEDDGLSLSLSLKCPGTDNHHRQHDNPSPPPPPPPPPHPHPRSLARAPSVPFTLVPSPHNSIQNLHLIKPSLYSPFPSPSDLNGDVRSYLRRLNVNRQQEAAVVEREEEEVVVSSPNSTVSTTSLSGGKRGEREENYEAERDSSSQYVVVSEDDDGGDAAARKKLRLSKDQAAVLEETFKEHNTLNPKQKSALAKQLDLRPRQVEVWFQNRRARTKLKQMDVDCEYLKRCCETLTDENRRLQKEVNELRALKLSPQFYMNMNPPTTLIMCPQCERVTGSSSSSSSTASVANTRHQNPVGPYRPKPIPAIPWARVISPQALDAHHPRSRS